MSEYKVGDKVRILAGEKAGRIGTVEGIYKDRSAIDHYQINLGDELLFFDAIEIDSAGEIAKLVSSTPTERQDAEKIDKESEHIAKLMVETTAYNAGYDKGYDRGHEDGYKEGYDAHCKEIAQAGIDVMHSEYKRGWRECRAKMMEFISKDYQDDLGRVDE